MARTWPGVEGCWVRVREGKSVRGGARCFPLRKKQTCVCLNTVVLVADPRVNQPGGRRFGISPVSPRSWWVVSLCVLGARRLRYVKPLQYRLKSVVSDIFQRLGHRKLKNVHVFTCTRCRGRVGQVRIEKITRECIVESQPFLEERLPERNTTPW